MEKNVYFNKILRKKNIFKGGGEKESSTCIISLKYSL